MYSKLASVYYKLKKNQLLFMELLNILYKCCNGSWLISHIFQVSTLVFSFLTCFSVVIISLEICSSVYVFVSHLLIHEHAAYIPVHCLHQRQCRCVHKDIFHFNFSDYCYLIFFQVFFRSIYPSSSPCLYCLIWSFLNIFQTALRKYPIARFSLLAIYQVIIFL